jgi:hypothetical protein
VKASEISRYELDTSLYGQVEKIRKIYDILGFKKTSEDKSHTILNDLSKLPKQDQKLILEYLLSNGVIRDENDDVFDPDAVVEEPFPFDTIRDNEHLNRILANIKNIFIKAHPVKYEKVLRQIRTSYGDDKTHIGYRYRGHCQMCEKRSPYWEIAEIIPEPQKEISQMNLSFCPTCAAQYRRLRHDENIMREFKHNILNADINGKPVVNIGDSQIHFTATHLAEIQELLRLQQEEL